jgi:hypothetical protein
LQREDLEPEPAPAPDPHPPPPSPLYPNQLPTLQGPCPSPFLQPGFHRQLKMQHGGLELLNTSNCIYFRPRNQRSKVTSTMHACVYYIRVFF